MKKAFVVVFAVGLLLLISLTVAAQSEFAATLEVLSPGVTVQRANTVNPIAVQVEAIVGVGDVIRTDGNGRVRITFFADGTDVTLEANTEYRIVEFAGNDDDFRLTVEVIAGQTTHRLNRALGTNSKYDVETPGMTLAARGTVFAIRVEDSGRSAMLVREGTVDASALESHADVPPDFGIRAAVDSPLSDVVHATTFDELDSALDGCGVSVTTPDDVRMNVRLGPSLDQPSVGTIPADELAVFYGVSESGQWYRIPFRGGFGWLLSSTAKIQSGCAGLRVFPDTQVEDVNLYETLGDPIDIESLQPAEITPEPGGDS